MSFLVTCYREKWKQNLKGEDEKMLPEESARSKE